MTNAQGVLELVGSNLHSTAGAAIHIKVRSELRIPPRLRAKNCLAADEARVEGEILVKRITFTFHVLGEEGRSGEGGRSARQIAQR
jgi:hypothetical protein